MNTIKPKDISVQSYLPDMDKEGWIKPIRKLLREVQMVYCHEKVQRGTLFLISLVIPMHVMMKQRSRSLCIGSQAALVPVFSLRLKDDFRKAAAHGLHQLQVRSTGYQQ